MVKTKVSSNSDKKILDGTSDEGYIADSEGRDWVYSATQGTVSDATWVFNWKQMRARWHPDYLFGARQNFTVHRHWDEDYINSDYIIAIDADKDLASYSYQYPVYNQSVTLTEKSDSLRKRRRGVFPWFCIILIFILGVLITVPIIVAMILSSTNPASPSDILGRVKNELILAKLTYTEEMANASSTVFKELVAGFEKEMGLLYLSNTTRNQYAGSKISRVVFLGNDSVRVDYDLFFRVKNMRIPTHKTLRTILFSVERDKMDQNLGVLGDLRFRMDSHTITESRVVKRNDMNTTLSNRTIIVQLNKDRESSTRTTNLLNEKTNKSDQDSARVITNKIIIKTEYPGKIDEKTLQKDDTGTKFDESNHQQTTKHSNRSVEKITTFQTEISPMAPTNEKIIEDIRNTRPDMSYTEIVTRSSLKNKVMQNNTTEYDVDMKGYFTKLATDLEQNFISTLKASRNLLSTTSNPNMIYTAQTVDPPTTDKTSAFEVFFETTKPIPAKGLAAKEVLFYTFNKTLVPSATPRPKHTISKPNSNTKTPNSEMIQPDTLVQAQTTTVSQFDFDSKQLETSSRTATNFKQPTESFQPKSEIQSTTAYSKITTETLRLLTSPELTTKKKSKTLQVSHEASEARRELLTTLPSPTIAQATYKPHRPTTPNPKTSKAISDMQKSTIASQPMNETQELFSFGTSFASILKSLKLNYTQTTNAITETFTNSKQPSFHNTISPTKAQLQTKRTSPQMIKIKQTLTTPTLQTTDFLTTTTVESTTTDQQPLTISLKSTIETQRQMIPEKMISETSQPRTITSQSTSKTKEQRTLSLFKTQRQPQRVSHPFTGTRLPNDSQLITIRAETAERLTSSSQTIPEKEWPPLTTTFMAKTQLPGSKSQQTSQRSKTTTYDYQIDTEEETVLLNPLTTTIHVMNQTLVLSNTKESLSATAKSTTFKPKLDSEHVSTDSQLLAKTPQRSTAIQLAFERKELFTPNLQSTTETPKQTILSTQLPPIPRQVASDTKDLLTETKQPAETTTQPKFQTNQLSTATFKTTTENVKLTAKSLIAAKTLQSPLTARDLDISQQTKKAKLIIQNQQLATTMIQSMTSRKHELSGIPKPTIKALQFKQPSQLITEGQQPIKTTVTLQSLNESNPVVFKNNQFRIPFQESTITKTSFPTMTISNVSKSTSSDKTTDQELKATHSHTKAPITAVTSLPTMTTIKFFTLKTHGTHSDKTHSTNTLPYKMQPLKTTTTVNSLPNMNETTILPSTDSGTYAEEKPITTPQMMAESQETTNVSSSTITSPTIFISTTSESFADELPTTKNSQVIKESQDPPPIEISLPLLPIETVNTSTTSKLLVAEWPVTRISDFVTKSQESTLSKTSQSTIANQTLHHSVVSQSTANRQSMSTYSQLRAESQELAATTILSPIMTSTTVSNMTSFHTTADKQPITATSQIIEESQDERKISGQLPITSRETVKTTTVPKTTAEQRFITISNYITDYEDLTTSTTSITYPTADTSTSTMTASKPPSVTASSKLVTESQNPITTMLLPQMTSQIVYAPPIFMKNSNRLSISTNSQFLIDSQEQTTTSSFQSMTIPTMSSSKTSVSPAVEKPITTYFKSITGSKEHGPTAIPPTMSTPTMSPLTTLQSNADQNITISNFNNESERATSSTTSILTKTRSSLGTSTPSLLTSHLQAINTDLKFKAKSQDPTTASLQIKTYPTTSITTTSQTTAEKQSFAKDSQFLIDYQEPLATSSPLLTITNLRPITSMPRFEKEFQEATTSTPLPEVAADAMNISTASQTNVKQKPVTKISQSVTESEDPSITMSALQTGSARTQFQDISTTPIILQTVTAESYDPLKQPLTTADKLPLSINSQINTASETLTSTLLIVNEEPINTSLLSWTNVTQMPKTIISQTAVESQNSKNTTSELQTRTLEIGESSTVLKKPLIPKDSKVIKALQDQKSTLPAMSVESVNTSTASRKSADQGTITYVSSSMNESKESAIADSSSPTTIYTLTGFLQTIHKQQKRTESQFLTESQEPTTATISSPPITSLPMNLYTSTALLTEVPQRPISSEIIPESTASTTSVALLSAQSTPTLDTSSSPITGDLQTTTSKPSISVPFAFEKSLSWSNSVETSTDIPTMTTFIPLSETVSSLSTTAVRPLTTTISPKVINRISTNSLGIALVPPFSGGIGILFPPDTIPIGSASNTQSIARGTQTKVALSSTPTSVDNARNQLFPFQPNFGGGLIDFFPSMGRSAGSTSNEISIINQNYTSRKAETTTAFNPSFEYLWSLGDSVLDTLLSREKMFRTPDRVWDNEHLSGFNSPEIQTTINKNDSQLVGINQSNTKPKETDVIPDIDEAGINLGVPITVGQQFLGTTNSITTVPVKSTTQKDNTPLFFNSANGIPLSLDNNEVLALLDNLPPLVRETTSQTLLRDTTTESVDDSRITKSVIPTLLDLQLDLISPTTLQTTKETTFDNPLAAEKPGQTELFPESTFDIRSNNLLGFGNLGNMFGGGMFGILGNSDFLLREPIQRSQNNKKLTISVTGEKNSTSKTSQNLEKRISKTDSLEKRRQLDQKSSASLDINSFSSEINSPLKNNENSFAIIDNRSDKNTSKSSLNMPSSKVISRNIISGDSNNNRVLNEIQPMGKLNEIQPIGNNMVIGSSNLLNNDNFGFFGNFLNMDTNDILQPSLTIPDTSLPENVNSASGRGVVQNELQSGAIDFILPASNRSMGAVPVLSEFPSDSRNGMNLLSASNLQDISGSLSSFDISNVLVGKEAITIPPSPSIDVDDSLKQGALSLNSTSIQYDTFENDTNNLVFTRERPGLFSISSSDQILNTTENSSIDSPMENRIDEIITTQISEIERTVNKGQNKTLISTEGFTSSTLTVNSSLVMNSTNQTNTGATLRNSVSTMSDNSTSIPELLFEPTQKAYIGYPITLVWRLFSIEGWKFVIVQKEIPDASPVIIGVVTEQSMIAAPGFSTLSISTDSIFTSSEALIYVDIPSIVCEDEGMYTVRVLGTSNIVLAERTDFLPIFDVPVVQAFVADNIFEASNFQDPYCVASLGYPLGRLFLQVRYPGDESYSSFMSTPDVENVTLTSACRKVVRVTFGEYLNKTRDLNVTEVRCGVVDTPTILNKDGITFSNVETINIIPDTLCNNSSTLTTHPFQPCNYIDCAKVKVIDCPQNTCFNSTSNMCDSVVM